VFVAASTPPGLYSPLPVPPTLDELAQLTRSYNLLLGQIKKTLTAQDQFVSHASHQLNTPLAIMRGELELWNDNMEELRQWAWDLAATELGQKFDNRADAIRAAREKGGAE
jgi:signal transduction histidine kinase